MHRTPLFRTASALLAIGLLSFSGALHASGDDGIDENIFAPEHYVPEAELQEYAAGRLGIVVPSYWRIYHVLAYRALTGHPLSKAELAALKVQGFTVGEYVGSWQNAGEEANGVGNWKKARAAVKGALQVEIGTAADVGEFSSILNCPADAFDRAAKTLAQRLASGGQQLAAAWLAGQDAVFANCSPPIDQSQRRAAPVVRPLVLPPALSPKAPAWLQKDAAYQRAAAHFYSGRYADARTQFLAIAGDAASPWQPLGKYLAARSLIRSATAVPGERETGADQRVYKEKLVQARAELASIAPAYAPARAMISWIDIRARPDERRRELSAALAADPIGPASTQMMTDYLFLMDQLDEGHKLAAASDPVSAWIGAMQAGADDPYAEEPGKQAQARRSAALDAARIQWDLRHETVWLVALLTNARAEDLRPAERKAAAAVKADSPAWVSLQYHLARVAIAEGRVKQADSAVSALLKNTSAVSVRNRLLRMKMVTAPTAEAALAAAPRIPTGEAGTPIPDEGMAKAAAPQFDGDLRAHLERHIPLAMLMKLRPALPVSQRPATADMIWTRAVLLGEHDIATAITDDVSASRDTTRHLYERYKKATTPEAKRDAALLVLANAPELVPYVSKENASYANGSYWSCYGPNDGPDGMDKLSPAFLSDAEREQVAKEGAQLRKLPRRSSYLIPLMIEWAKKNKADPEAPKALHFLIASTRNECGTGAELENAPHYSKLAFEFLHRQFPKSEWTARTRYYY
jgi:hypothetical protein